MAEKGSNLFNECAAECVHLCPVPLLSEGKVKCTHLAP